jgi:hypothetical protein
MNLMKRNRKMLLVVASLFLLAALPAMSVGQGRGRGQEKKLDKFVNGHDARDGRWDGRGPGYSRRSLMGNDMRRHRRWNRFHNRDFQTTGTFSNRGLRRRGFDNNQYLRSQRSRQWNRRFNRRGF